VTAQCWARQNTQGFEKACVVRIDGVTFVDTEAANAWLQRPRYPRTNLELKGQQEKGVPLVSAGEGNHD
jgi:hypothetical protein